MHKTSVKLTLLVIAAFSFAEFASVSYGGELRRGVRSRGVITGPAGDVFEIIHAPRGVAVKVVRNGRNVATLVMSKGRTASSSYCCTAKGCKEVEVAVLCGGAFKMTCDKNGTCTPG